MNEFSGQGRSAPHTFLPELSYVGVDDLGDEMEPEVNTRKTSRGRRASSDATKGVDCFQNDSCDAGNIIR